MAKTLSESAAEILKASVAGAGKEGSQLGEPAQDLGGATNDNPGGNAVGDEAAKAVGVAKKPGNSNDDGEKTPPKNEETEVDAVDDDENVDAETIQKAYQEELITKHKGSFKEDMDALFSGDQNLSEEFRAKATAVFEAAVQSRVTAIVSEIIAENNSVLEAAVEANKEELAEQIDGYLNGVVEEWITENQVAIESGLRAELAEGFITGLKNLFNEHYIEIPEEKIDVAEELATKVVDLEKIVEENQSTVAALTKELNESKKNESIRKICEGMTEVQISKMKSLAEGVEFTAVGDFESKLSAIKESYFPANGKSVKSEIKDRQEQNPGIVAEQAEVSSVMKHYMNAITATLPK